MKIKRGQKVEFKERAVFKQPEIFKKHRKNLLLRSGVVATVLGVDEIDQIANLEVISGGTSYTLWQVPLKKLKVSDKEGEIEVKDSKGTWFFGQHAKPVATIQIKPSPLARERTLMKLGRRPLRITPKTPRLR